MLISFSYFIVKYKNNKEIIETCDLIDTEMVYLALDETLCIDYEIDYIDEYVTISENVITANNVGETVIEVEHCKNLDIIVTDIYEKANLNNNKAYLKDGQYSAEDNKLLDNILEYKINNVGYQSRAAVVEAARFLLLNFKYKLNYFYENGRLDTDDKDNICDGEGRYYHLGLYLSDCKYEEISISQNGLAYWGKELYCDYEEEYCPNGLDCSGFISWALLNGGYDCKDIGSGPSKGVLDLSDLGDLTYIYDVDINKIKVGDLVGLDGHIGMIIGIDGTNIYIGEAYWINDLNVRTYSYREFLQDSEWEYVLYMDTYYKEDGNLSNMWY